MVHIDPTTPTSPKRVRECRDDPSAFELFADVDGDASAAQAENGPHSLPMPAANGHSSANTAR